VAPDVHRKGYVVKDLDIKTLRRERILIVDDSASVRGFLEDLLREEGYRVICVPNAESALDSLRSAVIDLLLLDIKMPGLSGIELLKQVQLLYPEVPVIMMTGYASLDSAREAILAGSADYVFKPFRNEEILLSITNTLDKLRIKRENIRLKETVSLFNISEAIASAVNSDSLHQIILMSTLSQTRSTRAALCVFDDSRRVLDVRAILGAEVARPLRPNYAGYPAVDFITQNRKPLLLFTGKDHPLAGEVDVMEYKTSIFPELFPFEKEMILFPLKIQDAMLGLILISKRAAEDGFTRSDMQVLSIIANQASVALHNSRLMKDLERGYMNTLLSLNLVLEAKHPYTRGHTQRVTQYSLMVAKSMGLGDEEMRVIRDGSTLHDIGKVGVSEEILNKKGSLTNEELQLIRKHPIIGDEIISPIRFLAHTRPIIRHHHERIDGKGWPDGVDGRNLPLVVRLVSVTDAFDAMTSMRPYRQPLTYDRICEEMTRNSGAQFDPDVVEIMLKLIRDGRVENLEQIA
jgi:response regulator RpfG family c-di-GMP phosphodiesterase